MSRVTALAAVIGSSACFATMGVLTKAAFAGGAEPRSLLIIRFAVAALVLAVAQLARDPRPLAVSAGDLGRFGLLALTGYGVASLCYAYAIREIGASVTTVLLYSYPAIVVVLGRVFLGEPLRPRRIAAVGLTFAGCLLVADVFAARSPVTPRGLALGLGAGIGYALFNVLSQGVVGRRPRVVIMTYTFGFAAIAIGALTVAATGWPSTAGWSAGAWVALGLIVLVPTFAAVGLYLGGIKGLGAPQAAVISTLELPFAIVLAAAFAGERLGPMQWLGAAIVLSGVLLAEWGAEAGEMDAAAV